MPSPFPGMDPYLESHWGDVHHRLITYASDAIQEALPRDLRARVEERVVLENPADWSTTILPDLRVVEQRPHAHGITTVIRPADGSMPLVLDAQLEERTEGFIEIIDVSSGNRVITIVEVLSPTNKIAGDGMNEYRRKQSEICGSDTSLVEINLLRIGKHVLAFSPDKNRPQLRTPYMVCVRRSWVRDKAEVYPIPLWESLPIIKIPLRPSDTDVLLDLQDLIEQCYRKGRYELDLDYRVDPDPPLSGAEAEWADELLRSKGLRTAPAVKQKRKRKPPRASNGKGTSR